MYMDNKINNYVRFFQQQVKDELTEYNRLKSVPIRTLFREDKLHWGFIDSVNPANGHIIIKIRKGFSPRLKVLKSFILITKKAKDVLGDNPRDWNLSFEMFKNNSSFHSGYSDLLPQYFIGRKDANYDYIGCSSVTLDMFNSIANLIKGGKSLMTLLFDPLPPTDYLNNIAYYTLSNKENPLLHIEPKISYDEWQPEELAYNSRNPFLISDTIKNTLEKESVCIIQGPPGTGKSYTIAQIVASYLNNEKSVCVTTMANKGLIELAKQPPLIKHLDSGKIFKTRLSSDEAKEVPGLHPANKDLIAPPGTLLCATNYVLSGLFSEKRNLELNKPHYDLIVIEEASQAFLSTIVAFKDLAKKCLIVGDPMQLPPIVKNADRIEYKIWRSQIQYDGLVNFALGTDIKSYRIITSFRLSEKSTHQTGVFYNNSLRSVQENKTDLSLIKNPFFPVEGGTIISYTNSGADAICSTVALQMIHFVIENISRYYPDYEVAIITPFRDTVKVLQKEFYIDSQNLDITVETIDRIQGMTVDYAIVYLPLNNIGFALSENRFNVATSRSKSTTLIISDVPLNNLASIPGKTNDFIAKCEVVPFQPTVNSSFDAEKLKSDSKVQNITPPSLKVKVVGSVDLSKFERKKIEIKEGKDNLYIIDTNVFVDNPDIISKIDRKYPIVLSAKVIDELDYLKIRLDSRGKDNVQKALKSINTQMTKRDVRMEFANLDLLPVEFDKRSPDNIILAVALKYKNENPILLTSDNGLQVKARGLNLTTISLKDIMKKY